jgi:hypothetical protein
LESLSQLFKAQGNGVAANLAIDLTVAESTAQHVKQHLSHAQGAGVIVVSSFYRRVSLPHLQPTLEYLPG